MEAGRMSSASWAMHRRSNVTIGGKSASRSRRDIGDLLRELLTHAHVGDMRRPAAYQAAGRFLRLVITYAAAGLSR